MELNGYTDDVIQKIYSDHHPGGSQVGCSPFKRTGGEGDLYRQFLTLVDITVDQHIGAACAQVNHGGIFFKLFPIDRTTAHYSRVSAFDSWFAAPFSDSGMIGVLVNAAPEPFELSCVN